jgi:SAM-dependent methyltransferase
MSTTDILTMETLDIGSGGWSDKHTQRGEICIDIMTPTRRIPIFVRSDAHFLPFMNESFRQVCLFEVIEHLENPTASLKEIHRTLKPEGKVIITTPNLFFWRQILRVLRRGRYELSVNSDHIAAFSLAEIENLARKNGYSVIEHRYTTLPKVHSKHGLLDAIMRHLLPHSISERNIVMVLGKH